ncbi:DUF6018 family natural product bioysynthesis protein [Cytobacillus purgationiresistens]|uniref:Homing endonuclease LAGLIDADG domain-containing protein n=1 Tax=Cytobacillus purgationiresistens TaxID=863449 RepID=A0ABU0AIZ2_9BACI|nr:DUF6018 family natural product bioysynthesis protein [Cytobacillus purgationiresistens]MDQ0271231.1 hypothetical protein [Cytobacillus purgationiresistens]
MSHFANLTIAVDSTLDHINSEVIGNGDCSRFFRMEILTPDGKRRYYSLKASSKHLAFKEASKIIDSMISSFKDERIMWRLTGTEWTIGSSYVKKEKKSLAKKVFNYFFDLEN